MSTELEKHLLKMKAMGVTITSKPAAGREDDFGERPFGIIQEAADRLGMGAEQEILHFAPWGSPTTSCGKPVPWNLDTITDRRGATTCEDCRSRFGPERSHPDDAEGVRS